MSYLNTKQSKKKKKKHTSLQDATALCKGVNHLLSLALTLAPVTKNMKTTEINNVFIIKS